MCTVDDNSVVGALLKCSSVDLSPLEVGLSLDAVTDFGVGVPHPFVIELSTSASNYTIAIGPQLDNAAAPSLTLNILTTPQYVVGASVCEPQSTAAWATNDIILDYEHCAMNPSTVARFNITVTLVHVDKPPYFTIPPLNITTSAVGVIGGPIWIPLSTAVVNPDAVYPYNITSFAVLKGPCSAPSSQYPLPFLISSSTGLLSYSVNGTLSAWESPLQLCVVATDGGLLNASLDVTVWLAPVPEQLVVSPASVAVTHYTPGVSLSSVSVLFSPGSHVNVSWVVQLPSPPWLTTTVNTTSSSIVFAINSSGLAALALVPPAYDAIVSVHTTGTSQTFVDAMSSFISLVILQTTLTSGMCLCRSHWDSAVGPSFQRQSLKRCNPHSQQVRPAPCVNVNTPLLLHVFVCSVDRSFQL